MKGLLGFQIHVGEPMKVEFRNIWLKQVPTHVLAVRIVVCERRRTVVRRRSLAQVQLPDAPGKDETVRMCGTCHEVERATSVRLNREGWQDTIAKMVDLGAKASDEELAKVLNYLAEHFKGEAPRR